MPGVLHQGVLSLFIADPWLAFDVLGRPRPGSGPLRDRRAEVEAPQVGGKKLSIGLPDLVLVSELDEEDGGLVLCVEAQAARDRKKRYALPFYQGALAYQHQLPTYMIVVSFAAGMSAAMRAWSQGAPPRVDVLILDADCVEMPSLERAQNRPTAAVLAAALHGRRGNVEAARIGLAACRGLPREQKLAYFRTILAALPEGARETIEQELPMDEYDPLWVIEKESSPYVYGVRDGREQGLKEGREEGRERGREEGRLAGRCEVLAEHIAVILELRGLELTPTQRERIESCEELDALRVWAKRAREVDSVSALFESETR